MTEKRSFTLDQQEIPFQPGDSILQAAQRAGVYVPHLCFHPDFSANGSCRLCVVSIAGKPVAACHYPARSGLQVTMNNSRLQQQRLRLLQLLFAEGNHFCPSCEVSGSCQLQALAYDLGMTHYHYDPFYPQRPRDGSHPDFFIDTDRCIFCDLCGRAGTEQDHKPVYRLGGRGEQTRLLIYSASGKLGDSRAAADDKAAHVCPVGCILPREGHYRDPIGERVYDASPIHWVGNRRRDQHAAPAADSAGDPSHD